MKKIIGAVLAALFLLLAVSPAGATDRVIWHIGQNPPSSWWNYMQRYTRLGEGQMIFDMLGRTTTPFYSNCSVEATTGLNVAVAPTNVNTLCSLYQYQADDLTQYGDSGGTGTAAALPADPNQIYVQGLIYGPTPGIGPLTAGTSSGQSVDNLIECMTVSLDTTSQSLTFVSALGVVTSAAANRDRQQTLSCQNKAGTSATTGSQVVPTVDTGYVAIGYVPIAYGASSVSTITPITTSQFDGFVEASALGSNAVFLSPSAQQTGTINVSGTITGNGLYSTALGTYSPISGVGNGSLITQSSTSQGSLWFGGAVSSAQLDYNSTNANSLTSSANLYIKGYLASTSLGSYSVITGTGAGDLIGQTGNSTGSLFLGGSGSAGQLDYGVTHAGAFSFGATPLAVGPTINSVRAAGYVPPVYSNNGGIIPNTAHIVLSSCAMSSSTSCSITLSANAVFTSQSSYACSVSTNGGTVNVLNVVNNSGTSITINTAAANSNTYYVACTGS